jgi:uncharacterized membrane protein YkoI
MTVPQYPYAAPPPPPPPNGKHRGVGVKIALLGAGAAAGAIVATTIGASAVTGSGSTTASSEAAATSAPTAPSGGDRHGSGRGRSDEKALDATTAAKLKAAALKAVPGGTVDRVETDSGDATYEAHMTKADGTEVTVKFDKDLAVTGVEAGMGK